MPGCEQGRFPFKKFCHQLSGLISKSTTQMVRYGSRLRKVTAEHNGRPAAIQFNVGN